MRYIFAALISLIMPSQIHAEGYETFDPSQLQSNESVHITGIKTGSYGVKTVPEIILTAKTVSAPSIAESVLTPGDIKALNRYMLFIEEVGPSGGCSATSRYHLRKFRNGILVDDLTLWDRGCVGFLRRISAARAREEGKETQDWLTPGMIHDVISARSGRG